MALGLDSQPFVNSPCTPHGVLMNTRRRLWAPLSAQKELNPAPVKSRCPEKTFISSARNTSSLCPASNDMSYHVSTMYQNHNFYNAF